MATAILRSCLRGALRGGASTPRASIAPKRHFSSSASHDEAAEASKWEKITYAGIVSCSVLVFYNLSKGHPHYDKPPALHTRTFISVIRSFNGALMASLGEEASLILPMFH